MTAAPQKPTMKMSKRNLERLDTFATHVRQTREDIVVMLMDFKDCHQRLPPNNKTHSKECLKAPLKKRREM